MADQDFVSLVLPPLTYQKNRIPIKTRKNISSEQEFSCPGNHSRDLPDHVYGFEGYLSCIGDRHGFHNIIYRAIFSYVVGCSRGGKRPDKEYLKNRLKNAILQADPGKRSPANIRRYASDSYLSREIQSGIKNFQILQEKEPRKAEKPFYQDESIPLSHAREKLTQEIEGFFKNVDVMDDLPPVLVLAPDVGVGKTEQAVKSIARFIKKEAGKKHGKIVYSVPTHTLASEIGERLEKEGVAAFIFRGRSANNPQSAGRMCADMQRVDMVQSCGLEIERYACGTGKKTGQKCPLYEICAYQQQKKKFKDASVIIFTHPMLFLPPPHQFKIDCLIIDESFFNFSIPKFDQESILSLSSMRRHVRNADSEDREFIEDITDRLEITFSACPDRRLTRMALQKAGISLSKARRALSILENANYRPNLGPYMDVHEMQEAVKGFGHLKHHRKILEFWRTVENFVQTSNETCPRIKISSKHKIKILSCRKFHKAYAVPTLILDATARVEILQVFFPHLQDILKIEIDKPYQRIRQITDTSFPYESFRQSDNNSEETNQEGIKRIRKVRDFIEMQAIRYQSSARKIDVLVICPKEMRNIIGDLTPLPHNVEITHFGAFRGKDQWRDVRIVIVVSRPLAASAEIADMVEALTGEIVEERNYAFTEKSLRTKQAGDCPILEDQPIFIHSLGEAIRWTITEGELIQAIGRGRGVNRTAQHALDVDILTNVVLPVSVDDYLCLNDILPDRYDKMSLEGIVLLNAQDQARMYPDLSGSPQGAKSYAKRIKKRNRGHSSIESVIIEKCLQLKTEGKNPPLTHKMSYRTQSRGKMKTLFFNANKFKNPITFLSLFVDVRYATEPEILV